MTGEMNALLITAASIGFVHTLLGPDHYLPFIMMAWARKWSVLKTVVVTFVCGIGHVVSSVVLGLIGVALGVAVKKLELVESVRGDIAAWLLIGLGLAYLVWGLRAAYKKKLHTHSHYHTQETAHSHEHDHEDGHIHVHDYPQTTSITPWVLFTIFVFGPCEPLIPILMYPAAKNSLWGLLIVTTVFATATIGTMLAAVLLAGRGVRFFQSPALQRYSHAIAGGTILVCGLAIVFLGL